MLLFVFAIFSFVLDSYCSLGPCRAVGPVLEWVVGMSIIVHAFILSSTGIDVCVASARSHSSGGADAGLCFLPTAWAMGGLLTSLCTPVLVFTVGFDWTYINKQDSRHHLDYMGYSEP